MWDWLRGPHDSPVISFFYGKKRVGKNRFPSFPFFADPLFAIRQDAPHRAIAPQAVLLQ